MLLLHPRTHTVLMVLHNPHTSILGEENTFWFVVSSPKAESKLNICSSMYFVKSTFSLPKMMCLLMLPNFYLYSVLHFNNILFALAQLFLVYGSFADNYSDFGLIGNVHYSNITKTLMILF
jgi:hypothetical protein